VSLSQLRDLDNTVFANSLRRLVYEIDAATDQTAGFNNSA
jgi:FXSXX-COOH protein